MERGLVVMGCVADVVRVLCYTVLNEDIQKGVGGIPTMEFDTFPVATDLCETCVTNIRVQ